MSARPISRVIVHHSAGPETTSAADIERDHRARGFNGIGYHWLVRRLGGGPWTLEAGRPEGVVGAHDSGQNTGSIGICIAGDYSKGPVPPDGWIVLVATVADVCRRYGLTADQIEGHREHETKASATLCPGFDPATLRLAVATHLAAQ